MEELVAQNNSIQSTIIQSKTYLQVLPVTLSNDSYSVRINALLDCRADSTLVREDIAKILHIKGEQKSLKTQNALESKLVNFTFCWTITSRKYKSLRHAQYQTC